MKTRRIIGIATALYLSVGAAAPVIGGQALQPVNIATNASGQSGYIASLIEAKALDVKYGIKITNLMMDFTEAANAVKLLAQPARGLAQLTRGKLVDAGEWLIHQHQVRLDRQGARQSDPLAMAT